MNPLRSAFERRGVGFGLFVSPSRAVLAERLALQRQNGDGKSRIIDLDAGGESWIAELADGLRCLRSEWGWSPGAPLEIVLSPHFADSKVLRIAGVPGGVVEDLVATQSKRFFARPGRLLASGHRTGRRREPGAVFAVACEASLADALEGAAEAAGLRLVSISSTAAVVRRADPWGSVAGGIRAVALCWGDCTEVVFSDASPLEIRRRRLLPNPMEPSAGEPADLPVEATADFVTEVAADFARRNGAPVEEFLIACDESVSPAAREPIRERLVASSESAPPRVSVAPEPAAAWLARLALRNGGTGSRLVPSGARERRRRSALRRRAGVAVVALLNLALAGHLYRNVLEADLDALHDARASTGAVLTQVRSLEVELRERRDRDSLAHGLEARRVPWTVILSEMAEALPVGVHVRSFRGNTSAIELVLEGDEAEDLRFESTPSLEIHLIESAATDDGRPLIKVAGAPGPRIIEAGEPNEEQGT